MKFIIFILLFIFCNNTANTAFKEKQPLQKVLPFLDNFQIEDIDLDGNNEILIVTKDASKIILLRETNGIISLISKKIPPTGYAPYSAKIIRLEHTDKKYIFVGLTNGFHLFGFGIFDLTGNELVPIYYGASPTGSGIDELIDSNQDGAYDKHVQNRGSYDYFYYNIVNYYTWDGKEFIYDTMDIDMPKYPAEIKDVIQQYMELSCLYDEKNEAIYNRLKELSTCEILKENDKKSIEKFLCSKDSFYFASNFDFIINQEDTYAKADILWESYDKKYDYSFSLKKIKNKWVIKSVDIKKTASLSNE